METGWGIGAKKGSKNNKKNFWDEPKDDAPEVVTAPDFEQEAGILNFGTKEDSKKKAKKGASDESKKLVNPVFAFEGESEPERDPEP